LKHTVERSDWRQDLLLCCGPIHPGFLLHLSAFASAFFSQIDLMKLFHFCFPTWQKTLSSFRFPNWLKNLIILLSILLIRSDVQMKSKSLYLFPLNLTQKTFWLYYIGQQLTAELDNSLSWPVLCVSSLLPEVWNKSFKNRDFERGCRWANCRWKCIFSNSTYVCIFMVLFNVELLFFSSRYPNVQCYYQMDNVGIEYEVLK